MEYNIKEYLDCGKEIIKVINQNGAEAYFVGECVRDIILKRPIKEVHLFSTATNDQLMEIFRNYPVSVYDETTIRLNYMEYIYYISTFKLAVPKMVKERVKRHYCTKLVDYLERKDFIINALAMNYSNKIIDLYDARGCIKKKKIRVYGVGKTRFNENPLNMIKALSLVSQLGYRLDRNVIKGIKKRKKLLLKLEPSLIAVEFRNIIEGKYFKRAINLIDDLRLSSKIPVIGDEVKRLTNRFKAETVDEFFINVMVKNGEIDYSLLKACDNQEFVKNSVNLALANPKGDYDVLTLFRNGLDVCLAANKSNHIWHKAKNRSKKIKKAYNALPIKKTCDLAFKGQDILEITKDSGGRYLEQLIDDIQAGVLFGELVNEYEAIRVFVYRRLYEMKKDSNDYTKPVNYEVSKVEKENEAFEVKNRNNENVIQENIDKDNVIINNNLDDNIVSNNQESVKEDKNLQLVQFENTNNNNNNYVDLQYQKNNYNLDEENKNEKSVKDAIFEERIRQINLDALEEKLNLQIDELIKKSNILDEMRGNEAIDTYNRMKKRYREVLLEKYPEYSKLKDRYNDKK